MKTENNKISVRQAMTMYMVASYSPITRLFPAVAARSADHAGWVAAIVSSVSVLLLAKIFASFFKNGANGPANLSDVYDLAFGKVVSKAILVFYAVWIALLFVVYIRYFAEQMLSTMFPSANIGFFVITMMAIVLVAARGRIEAFARFSELSFIIFALILAILALCLIPVFDIKNLFPVTYFDIKPVLRGSVPMISILGYFSLFFFLGDHISDKENTWKRGSRAALYLGIVSTSITGICIATLSFRVLQRMPMPFFSTTKLITVMQPLDRMEAFLLCAWVISDFIIITAFAFILMNITKKLFNAREARFFSTPIVFFGLVGGLYLVTSRFELEAFSNSFLCIGTNAVSGFVIPVAALIVGKLRGKI
ncbi:MAG: spore germination protein [Oscillospiraceae bacterium]|nr:spore germination protein [Oscillospiraceae bacterium]